MTIDTFDIVVNLLDKHCELIMLDCSVRKCLVWKINGSNINKLVAAMDTITLVKELSKISTKYCLLGDFGTWKEILWVDIITWLSEHLYHTKSLRGRVAKKLQACFLSDSCWIIIQESKISTWNDNFRLSFDSEVTKHHKRKYRLSTSV